MKKLSQKDLEALSKRMDIEAGLDEELAEKASHGIFGFYDPKSDEIYVSEKSTTPDKIHEFRHKEVGPPPKGLTPSGWVDREIDAEIYSFTLVGKRLSWKVAISAISFLVNIGESPNYMFSLIVEALGRKGITLSRKERSNMWWFIREAAEGGEYKEYLKD